MSQEVLTELVKALERGEDVALVTIVAAQGSTPQRVGAKMIVFPDGRTVGTIGGGCYENDAFWKAKEALQSRKPQLVKYDLTDDFAQESGLICGGQMTVYIEPVEPAPQLYIIGAGHVGHQLGMSRVRSASASTCSTIARSSPTPSASPTPTRSSSTPSPTGCTRRRSLPTPTWSSSRAAIKHDLDALRSLAARDLRYIGLIGSKAKIKKIYDALTEEGMPLECLSRIHAPVGLDIGAVSPEEIAISILAELIAVRRGRIDEPHVAAASLQWKKLPASLTKE